MTRQIFIAHGHDLEARDQLEAALLRLELAPFILMKSGSEGNTLIEALEEHIGKEHASDFGIVLLTPDDMGYARANGEDSAAPRARQNVILEMGMLLASLTHSRIVLLVKGHLELPSDLDGIIVVHYDTHIREALPKLAQRLQACGFEISPHAFYRAVA